MYWKIFAGFVLLSGAATAAEPIAFRASAKVEVDSTGKPVKIETAEDLPRPIRDHIETTVKNWHFSPPSRDGLSGSGITYVSLGACAMPEGKDYRMAIDFKGNGPRPLDDSERHGLRYPADAQRAGRAANLHAYWIVETDGSATLERIEREGGSPLKKRDSFHQAVQDWVSQLRYEPEQFAGRRVRTRMSGPMIFRLSSARYLPMTAAVEKLNQVKQSPECLIAASKLEEPVPTVAIDSPFKLEAL